MGMFRQWASFVKRLVHVIAKPMKRDFGSGGMMVQPYRGYGSQREVFVMGRVFRQAALGRAIPRRGMLRDTADVTRRIFRRGFADAKVELSLGAISCVSQPTAMAILMSICRSAMRCPSTSPGMSPTSRSRPMGKARFGPPWKSTCLRLRRICW